MRKVSIQIIRSHMFNLLKPLQLSSTQAEFIVKHFLDAELSGKTTHGIGKFCWESQYFKERLGTPFVESDKKTTVLVNANKEIGPLAAQFAIELLKKRAKKYGIAIVAMKNAQRYGSLETWVSSLAESNLIGLVMNTSEPLVPHPDSISGVLGTNPIGIGIPTEEEPIVVDMATSKEAMGLTWQMIREGKKLPKKTFYNEQGNYTVDPELAKSVEVFGEYKGFGISLFIQILCTSLLGLPTFVKDKYQIGYAFIAINPTIFSSIETFKDSTSNLIEVIKKDKRRKGAKEVIIPGENARRKRKNNFQKGYITISDDTWNSLTNAYE